MPSRSSLFPSPPHCWRLQQTGSRSTAFSLTTSSTPSSRIDQETLFSPPLSQHAQIYRRAKRARLCVATVNLPCLLWPACVSLSTEKKNLSISLTLYYHALSLHTPLWELYCPASWLAPEGVLPQSSDPREPRHGPPWTRVGNDRVPWRQRRRYGQQGTGQTRRRRRRPPRSSRRQRPAWRATRSQR